MRMGVEMCSNAIRERLQNELSAVGLHKCIVLHALEGKSKDDVQPFDPGLIKSHHHVMP